MDATGALSRDVTSVSVSFIEDHHALWQSTQSCFSIQIIFLSRSGSIRGENPFSKWRTGLGSFQDLCGFGGFFNISNFGILWIFLGLLLDFVVWNTFGTFGIYGTFLFGLLNLRIFWVIFLAH